MNDLIGLFIIVAILVIALWGMGRLAKGRAPLTEEEYERNIREKPGAMSGFVGGFMNAMHKLTDPAAGRAAIVQSDFKQGYYKKKQNIGDDDDTDAARDGLTTSGAEEEK